MNVHQIKIILCSILFNTLLLSNAEDSLFTKGCNYTIMTEASLGYGYRSIQNVQNKEEFDQEFALHFINGFYLKQPLFLGLGLAWANYRYTNAVMAPFYFTIRYDFTRNRIQPYVNAQLGYSISLSGKENKGGAYTGLSTGIQWNRSGVKPYIGFGLSAQQWSETGDNLNNVRFNTNVLFWRAQLGITFK
ncbi:MAG: hypothetical protein MUE33_12525 [Cytophagaceae bacterium]|jgi:hypothetical protein|nr:hypothetical protein [Cytophagaceae bacterium]